MAEPICLRCHYPADSLLPDPDRAGKWLHPTIEDCRLAILSNPRKELGTDAYIDLLERYVESYYDALDFYRANAAYQFWYRDNRGGIMPGFRDIVGSEQVYDNGKFRNRILEDSGETARRADDGVTKSLKHHVGWMLHKAKNIHGYYATDAEEAEMDCDG